MKSFARARTLILVFAVLSAGLGGRPVAGLSQIKRSRDINVLLITLDTTRADHIGCYGYAKAKTPAIDGLARNGVRFANAYAQVPLTLPSHSSIMTGTTPLRHQVHNNGYYRLGEENETLASAFKKNGYATAAFVASFTVDSRFGLGRGFDVYDDRFPGDEVLKNFHSQRRADQVFDAFSSWFEKAPRRKFFSWIHLYDPHLPYDPPAPYKQEFHDHPYDGEIAFADSNIAKIIAALKDKEVLDRTLIVIAGDHGEALGEKREIDHGYFLYEGTLRVPLVMFCPAALPQGIVVDPRVRLMDLMPTIMDLTKIAIPGNVEGTTLLPCIAGQAKEPLTTYIETVFPFENFGWAPLAGIIDGDWKYIKAPRPELYNLKSDPREEVNLVEREKKVADAEAGKLADILKKGSRPESRGTRILTAEEKEKLRSLGYLGGRPPTAAPSSSLADPKDKIGDYALYFRANLMETENRLKEAEDGYRQVSLRNPEAPAFYVDLGMVEMKMGRVAEAVQTLEQARAKFSDSLIVLSPLMSFYFKAGRWDDGLAVGRDILGIDPRNFEALFLSGSANARQGKWAEASALYDAALEIEPANKTLRQRAAYAPAAAGDPEKALTYYDRLKKDYPHDGSFDRDLAQVYEMIDKLPNAPDLLKAAVERHPSPDAYYAYARRLAQGGDFKGAVRWLKRFLETASATDAARKTTAQQTLSDWKKRSSQAKLPPPGRGGPVYSNFLVISTHASG